jgi:hypothetical protein
MLWLKEEDYYAQESTRMVQGIMFMLPSRQRFIPYSWLLYSEVNERQTEIHFHYTHTVVTITGTNLRSIHDAVVRYELYVLRECRSPQSRRTNRP